MGHRRLLAARRRRGSYWDAEYAKTHALGRHHRPGGLQSLRLAGPDRGSRSRPARCRGRRPRRASNVLNGGQVDTFGVRMRPGDVITSRSRLSHWDERQGRFGLTLYIFNETEWRNQNGEFVKTAHLHRHPLLARHEERKRQHGQQRVLRGRRGRPGRSRRSSARPTSCTGTATPRSTTSSSTSTWTTRRAGPPARARLRHGQPALGLPAQRAARLDRRRGRDPRVRLQFRAINQKNDVAAGPKA